MLTIISIGVAVLFFVLVLVAIIVAVLVALRFRRSSLVPKQVRQALNADLDASITKKHVDDVKRDWLKGDGWTFDESESK